MIRLRSRGQRRSLGSLSLSLSECVSLENDLKVNETSKTLYSFKALFYGQILLFSI